MVGPISVAAVGEGVVIAGFVVVVAGVVVVMTAGVVVVVSPEDGESVAISRSAEVPQRNVVHVAVP